MQNNGQPQRTPLTLGDDAGNTFALVVDEGDGDTLGIVRNGVALPDCRWPREQVEAGARELLRRARARSPAPARPRRDAADDAARPRAFTPCGRRSN